MKIFKIIGFLITFVSRTYLFSIACLTLWILIPLALMWTPTVVISGSMEPTIMTGDALSAQKVTVSQVYAGAIKPGMVVLATDPMKPETLFTHRVIKVLDDKSMITKGDANLDVDPMALPPENVQGIERLRIPFVGLPAQALYSGDLQKLGLMLLSIIIPLLIVNRKTEEDEEAEEAGPAKEVETQKVEQDSTKSSDQPKSKAIGFVTISLAAALALAIVSLTGTASAAFTGSVVQPNNSLTASTAFPSNDPRIVNCGTATYTSSVGTTVTCTPGTVSGKTSNYTLTVKGTGALTEWTVTANWNNVTGWLKSRAYGTGVTDTGDILVRNGYQIRGFKGNSTPSDSRNYAWVSSTKPAVTFTVQVTTQ